MVLYPSNQQIQTHLKFQSRRVTYRLKRDVVKVNQHVGNGLPYSGGHYFVNIKTRPPARSFEPNVIMFKSFCVLVSIYPHYGLSFLLVLLITHPCPSVWVTFFVRTHV